MTTPYISPVLQSGAALYESTGARTWEHPPTNAKSLLAWDPISDHPAGDFPGLDLPVTGNLSLAFSSEGELVRRLAIVEK